MQEAKSVALTDEPMIAARSHELRDAIERARGTNRTPAKDRSKRNAQKAARRKQRKRP